MFAFVFAIIFWIGTLVCVVGALAASDYKAAWVAGGVFSGLIGFGIFAIAGLYSVPVKNIGVPSSFGSVSNQIYEPGMHETWNPFLHITNIDETVQTTTFEGNNCLTVRIGGQQSACADITIQWKILPQAAGSLYSDYANSGDLMQTVTNAVVVRELKQVVNNVVGDYNPITDVQTVTNTPTATSQFSSFGPQILKDMQADIGNRIEVQTVLMPFIHYDPTVEQALQRIQIANSNYAVAVENVKVNQEQALSYAKLGTPSVAQLAAECLSDMKDGMQAPTGFQCMPGASSNLAVSAGG